MIAAVVILNVAHFTGTLQVFSLYVTNKWFGAVAQRLDPKTRFLDIGCGISAIKSFVELALGVKYDTIVGTVKLLLAAGVTVVGIEGDILKFKKAAGSLKLAGLSNKVVLHNKSICDAGVSQVFSAANQFNAICFSTPIKSYPDPIFALRAAASVLKEGGVVYVPFVVNYPSKFSMCLSPIFKLLGIASLSEIKAIVNKADLEVISDLPAVGDDGKDDKKPQAARVLVLQRRTLSTTTQPTDGDNSLRSRKSHEPEL